MSEPTRRPSQGASLADRWAVVDRYWFGAGSPVTLGLFRILMCGLCFINLAYLAPDWEAWFSEKGYIPAWLGQLWLGGNLRPFQGSNFEIPRLNVLNGVTDPRITIPFFTALVVCSLLGCVGWGTRWAVPVLAIGVVTLHHRDIAILHGGDTLLRVTLIYLAVSPCGRACSVDRLVGRWRGTEPAEPAPISVWPQRLVTYQIALVYFTTVWIKYYGVHWKDGTSTWYTARLAEFFRFPVPGFFNQFPIVQMTTYGTLAVEFSLATLVFFRPLRTPILIAGVIMHQYIDYSMNIPLFSFLMISTYVCFYDGDEISAFARRIGAHFKAHRLIVRIPNGFKLRPEFERMLPAADPFRLVSIEAGVAGDLESGDGKPLLVTRGLWWRSPILAILGLGTPKSLVECDVRTVAETPTTSTNQGTSESHRRKTKASR